MESRNTSAVSNSLFFFLLFFKFTPLWSYIINYSRIISFFLSNYVRFHFYTSYASSFIRLFLRKEPESVGQSTTFLCTPISGEASMKESVVGRERERYRERQREICVFACILNLTVTRMFQVLFQRALHLCL